VSVNTLDEQLDKYLADVHSIEEQALAQMRRAPDIAGDARLAEAFAEHLPETRAQEDRVRRRLEDRGADTAAIKDLAGKLGGVGMIAFAKANPDTPGKLTAHAYSYEHMEIAAYDLLIRVAERANDDQTVEMAAINLSEERGMAQRLAGLFDVAAAASLRDAGENVLDDQLVKYLVDAHAIEQQAEQLLRKGPDLVDDGRLADLFRRHLAETEGHSELIAQRLEAHDAKPSKLQDAAMRLGGLNLGAFFGAQPDTTAKLAGFAFAFEHLEIAAYELLRRIAERAADAETVATARSILAEERAAADELAGLWDYVLDTELAERRVAG
jgi:ferritin-like metal-binding protein YciE